MNDLGVDEALQEAAETADGGQRDPKLPSDENGETTRHKHHRPKGKDDPEKGENNEEEEKKNEPPDVFDPGYDDSLQKNRFWMTSTAFPLIAATTGPLANMFSICSIVSSWRVAIPPGGEAYTPTVLSIPDPKWAIALNAISLVSGVIANVVLLFGFAKRLKYRVSIPITVVLWYMSSILLICDLVPYSLREEIVLPAGTTGHGFSQSFYYAIISTVIYAFISTFLCISYLFTLRPFYRYPPNLPLTVSQRTLMLQTISLIVYMTVGAAIFCALEGWTYNDGVYFCNVTLLTIGLGDLTPTTHAGRAVLIPYSVGGILTIGMIISSIRSLVLERGKNKVGRRILEKKRRTVVRRLTENAKARGLSPSQELLEPGEPAGGHLQRRTNTILHAMGTRFTLGAKLEKARKTYEEEHEDMSEKEKLNREEFMAMRAVQKRAETMRRWTSLCTSLFAFFTLWLLGALVFFLSERTATYSWTYFQALYFCFICLITVGYGDFSPTTNSSKPFFVIWTLLGVPTMTILISNMGDTVIVGVRILTEVVAEWGFILPEHNKFSLAVQHMRKKKKNDPDEGTDTENLDDGTQTNGNPDARDDDPQDMSDSEEEALDRDVEKVEAESGIKKLVDEIRIVIGHISEHPPKRYTFDEWDRYMRLATGSSSGTGHGMDAHIGDGSDMNRTRSHGKRGNEQAVPDPKNKDQELSAEWSWLSHQSPLMSKENESEWVLQRLYQSLLAELDKIEYVESSGTYGEKMQREEEVGVGKGSGKRQTKRDPKGDDRQESDGTPRRSEVEKASKDRESEGS